MFLEKCGQFFFSRMRPLFFFALVVLPLIFVALLLFVEYTHLQDLEGRFANAARKEKIASQRKGRKERFLARYSQANPYFLDQKIEGYPLLEMERSKIQSLLHHPAFPESRSLKDRLSFLEQNRFAFTEENLRSSAHIKEVEEKQRHPVQIDEHDLKKILSTLEDISIGPFVPPTGGPQIVIKDFRLKKQETSLQTDIFEVEMDLLKREFIK